MVKEFHEFFVFMFWVFLGITLIFNGEKSGDNVSQNTRNVLRAASNFEPKGDGKWKLNESPKR